MKAISQGRIQMSLHEVRIRYNELQDYKTTIQLELIELSTVKSKRQKELQSTLRKVQTQMAKLEGRLCKQESASNVQN